MEHQQTIKNIAEIILSELHHFDKNYKVQHPVTGNVFVHQDPYTTKNAQQTLNQSQIQVFQAQIQLKEEPFFAYVKAEVNESEKILFICRGYTPLNHNPVTPSGVFVNYKSPMGRAVEADVDTDFEFAVGTDYTEVLVLEKNLFKPVSNHTKWDGINNRFYLDKGVFSIKSLLEFLKPYVKIEDTKNAATDIEEIRRLEHELEKTLKQERRIRQGVQREVIDKMELRDQPILDKTQGEIFRLPTSSQIIITGAPGTGKTTTLIKRIAQKSDPFFLDEQEKKGLDNEKLAVFFNKQNWIMFTPTELLKIFLKEAFAKELLPASEKTIKTWDDERIIIARDTLGILQTGNRGFFIRTPEKLTSILRNPELVSYTKKFISFYNRFILAEFEKAHKTLQANQTTPKLRTRFSQIHAKVRSELKSGGPENTVFFLTEELKKARDLFNQKRTELDEIIEKIVIRFIESGDNVLQKVHKLIENQPDLHQMGIGEDDEEAEALVTEPALIAKRQIRRTLKWFSEKMARNQTQARRNIHIHVLKAVSAEAVMSLFGSREQLIETGKKIIDLKATDMLTRGHVNLLNRIPYYYHMFRLWQLKNNNHTVLNINYERQIREKRISDHETDMLIYIMLGNARKIFKKNEYLISNYSRSDILEQIKTKYKTQITIDEATDFSSVQLGCMFNLAHPEYTSVSFSGDLMQRVTPFGLTDWNECNFISDKFKEYPVDIVYRQSPKLLEIAGKLYEKSIGRPPLFKSAFTDNNDPDPLKFDSQNNNKILGQWIADRVVEIYNISHKLPSAAIFVAEDDQIDEFIKIIEEPLNNNAIQVKGCPRGEIFGSEGKVKIFSVKYIKGLEFESVFFADIDKISERFPELFDKYLYVGLTRAASFLAVTYNTRFPEKISFAEKYFKEGDWRLFGQ